MYSLITIDDEEIKKAKAGNKNFVDKIKRKEYVNVLFSRRLMKMY